MEGRGGGGVSIKIMLFEADLELQTVMAQVTGGSLNAPGKCSLSEKPALTLLYTALLSATLRSNSQQRLNHFHAVPSGESASREARACQMNFAPCRGRKSSLDVSGIFGDFLKKPQTQSQLVRTVQSGSETGRQILIQSGARGSN